MNMIMKPTVDRLNEIQAMWMALDAFGPEAEKQRVFKINEIQAMWMALDAFGPEAEKQRVFKMMEEYPHSYASVSADLSEARPMIHDGPWFACAMTLAEALEVVARHHGRTDVGWCGSTGKWVQLPS